jgi:hypothetical protein
MKLRPAGLKEKKLRRKKTMKINGVLRRVGECAFIIKVFSA